MDSGQRGSHEGDEGRAQWPVPVRDLFRPKLPPSELIVAVSDARVVVVPPGGAGHVVPHESIDRLCDALRAADSVAEHEKKVRRMDPPR